MNSSSRESSSLGYLPLVQVYHSASFFPHAHLPGLEHMRGVFAVIGRDQVRPNGGPTRACPNRVRADLKERRKYTDRVAPSQLGIVNGVNVGKDCSLDDHACALQAPTA